MLEARDPCWLCPGRSGRAGPLNNHYGRTTKHKARPTQTSDAKPKPMRKPPTWRAEGKPPSGGPRRRRGGPQVAVLASGAAAKPKPMRKQPTWRADGQATGRWAGAGSKSQSWGANAAATPPQLTLLASSQSPPAAAA